MRKSYLIISIVCFTICCFTLAYAEPTYKAKSADDAVASKDMVQVEVAEVITVKAVYTLSYLNTALAATNAKIAELQAEATKIQTLIDGVTVEADKVKLKVKKDVVVEEPK
ncbi:MAG: hypothetical protein ABIL06_13355 [Pseudomonadota bacterium]|uniref:Uncharacterized protein n=1 Tax=viral metagenome TaxID=1070528 RepID=A0A6M3XAF3_9ZZZZ